MGILLRIKGVFVLVQFVVTISILLVLMFCFRKHNHSLRKKWSALQIRLLGIKFEIEGEIDENSQMLMVNHQSLMDIIVLEHLHSKNIAWVGKQQIANIPFFGNIMKLPEMISINREDKTGIVTLFKESKDRLDKGRPIAIFPEGTRGDGVEMKSFKSGAKLLANKYELNVQPIVLFNTRKIFDSQKIKASSGTIRVVFLPSVKAQKDTAWFEDVEKQMRERFYESRVV